MALITKIAKKTSPKTEEVVAIGTYKLEITEQDLAIINLLPKVVISVEKAAVVMQFLQKVQTQLDTQIKK